MAKSLSRNQCTFVTVKVQVLVTILFSVLLFHCCGFSPCSIRMLFHNKTSSVRTYELRIVQTR